MRKLIIFLNLLSLSLLFSFSAFAVGISAQRGLANFSAYSFTGKIVGVSFSDDAVRIKIKNLNKQATSKYETLKLCQLNQYSEESLKNNVQMRLIEKALDTGKNVQVSYSDGFSKCLSEISFSGREIHDL